MVSLLNASFRSAVRSANSLTPKQVFDLLRPSVPGLKFVTRCKSIAEDKEGIDYRLYRTNGRMLSADLKELRRIPDAEDRILLELTIRGRNISAGWATDESKKTDLFVIVRGDGTFVVLSARQVREALRRNLEEWTKEYGVSTNHTPGYYEVFACDYIRVPRAVLEKACREISAEWKN
jgi:hypothetical protein